MTPDDLLRLIAAHETDRLELTISRSDTDKFAEAVCAFANDLPGHRQPGYLIIGVDDHGNFSGLRVTDELLRNLGGLRDDGNIQPLPSISVERIVTEKGEAAVVTVQPSLLPPVRYKGRIFIRSGPRRGYATEQDERILIERRVAHARTFDALPCLGSTVQDLSAPLFLNDYRLRAIAPEVIAENNRTLEQQLASLRFFDLQHNCPTNAGILLFGRDVLRWLPGAYVQWLSYDGLSPAAEVSDAKELVGDLQRVLRELDALIKAELRQFPVAESVLRERMVEAYSRVAVRELVMNAIMHRSYESTAPCRITFFSDRLEIQSPGGLYGEASPQNFPQQTSYRNPLIAETMKVLEYVNRYGRGVLRAQEALARNGSRPAEFHFDPAFVRATIWKLEHPRVT